MGLLAGILSATTAHAAAPPVAPETLLQAHLAAGEFAPALAIARRAPTPQQRDAFLAQVALAQAQAGARDASLRSTSEMQSDRARADALARLAEQPVGGQGGGPQPDFDSLIELITSTVQPATWDAAGGPGSIKPFPTGVYVDAQGILRPLLRQEAGARLADLRAASAAKAHQENVRRSSTLRMVSLPRLEKHVQLRLAAGKPPTEDMQVMAGLRRIKYVFVYPESGDIVLAGPAGDWVVNEENRVVSLDTGEPVVMLDDVVVVLRHLMSRPDARFGCLITPRQDGLARLKEYIEESSKRPLREGQRKSWLEAMRSRLGRQDIEVYGLDPRTRAARVMVEADYRMKLVGMGLEEGVPGVQSYLASIKLGPGQSPPPMGVLRWWFSMNYSGVVASKDGQAFEFRGQGVKVLSENEHLTALGERIHTGESEELNRQFAHSFTEHFGDLCKKYPVYAELRNLFDIALVGALMQAQDMPNKTDWHMTCFGNPSAYPVELGPAPKEVDSVVNHRVMNARTVVAGVSGGVACNPAPLVAKGAIEIESYEAVGSQRLGVAPKNLPLEAWWWD